MSRKQQAPDEQLSVCFFEREAVEGKRSGPSSLCKEQCLAAAKEDMVRQKLREWDTLSPNYRGSGLIFKIAKLSFTR